MPFDPSALALSLKMPDRLDGDGILVGWSMETEHLRRPIGFGFGDPTKTPRTGYIDPILLEGEGHLITIAPTGAGKGVGAIVPALLRFPGSVIVIDPKGENAAITARRRREMGQRVVILDPMGTVTDQGDRLDPLDLVVADSPSGVDDAVMLALALLPDMPSQNSAFWVSRARQLLTGLILLVATDPDLKPKGLTEVRRLINAAAANPGTLARLMRASRHPEVRQIAENLAIAANETLGGILAFAQEGIDFIRGPLVQRTVRDSTFDLDDVTRGTPLAIYIVLPPSMLESHGRLLRLWISVLISAILRRRRKPDLSTLFILDEAAQLGPLSQLRQALTLLRGYGLQTWSFWQDATQLHQLYPADWQTMVNNCRVLQAFGANNRVAAQSMSDLVGFAGAESVLDLDPDEMLLQIAGDEAIIAKRPDYRSDPAFAGMFDLNPLYDPDRDPMPPPRPPLRFYLRPDPAGPARTKADEALDADLVRRLLRQARKDGA